jgi:hypothetical protein
MAILEQEAARGWRDPRLIALLKNLANTNLEAAAAQSPAPWPPLEAMRQSLNNMHRALAGENSRPTNGKVERLR